MKSIPPKPPDPGPSPDPESEFIESPMYSPLPENPGSRKRLFSPSEETHIEPKKINTNLSESSPEVKTIYNHPSLNPENRKYTSTDAAPFIVHVARKESIPDAGLTINRIKFGQFLVHSNIKNIVLGGVKMVGRNKVSIEFSSYKDANSFLDHSSLSSANYLATIPTFHISRMGVIREIPVDITMDELVGNIILPPKCGEILRARRFNRKTFINNSPVWTPTQTIVLTFRTQNLPEKIFFCHSSISVVPYILPTIQCQRCCRFGHIKTQCRSQPRCYKCCQPHLGESCEIRAEDASCILCNGDHMATHKTCPEHMRQKNIKSCMAQNNISYNEATSRYPFKSFADAAKTPTFPSEKETEKTISTPKTSQKSFKKTIILPQKPNKPYHSKGYDMEAHSSIVGTYDPPPPSNGCAIIKNKEEPSSENIIKLLLTLILNLYTKQNSTPNNISNTLQEILNIIKHASDSVPTVEC